MQQRIWPILLVVIAWAGSLWFVYSHTRDSYSSVGTNDGIIEANLASIEAIRTATGAEQCHHSSAGSVKTKLFSSKDKEIYVIRHPNGLFSFYTFGYN